MLSVNHHKQIRDRANAEAELSVSFAAAAFDASSATLRRDHIIPEAQGRLRRVLGGAIPIGREGPPEDDRAIANATGKEAIGATFAEMPEPGMWVYVDNGPTALTAARAFADGPPLAPSCASSLPMPARKPMDGRDHEARHNTVARMPDNVDCQDAPAAIFHTDPMSDGEREDIDWRTYVVLGWTSATAICLWKDVALRRVPAGTAAAHTGQQESA